MKYLKRFFPVVVMVLCFSFCTGTVSHAKTIIKYKETKLSSPVKGFLSVDDVNLRVNSSGKIQLNLYKYHIKGWDSYDTKHACVTYSSNGKKQVNMAGTVNYSDTISRYSHYDRDVYGNYGYFLDDFYDDLDDDNVKLIVCKKKGEIVKTVKIDASKYRKRKTDYISFKIAEIAAKNKVRLFYYSHDWSGDLFYRGYGGMIEVNTTTKKVKRLVSTDFVPDSYDGKYVYGEEYDNTIGQCLTYYQKLIKTKKEKKIKTDSIVYDAKKYEGSYMEHSFYKGKIMAVCPTGEVYYATFDNKKFKKIGDISQCKNFKRYKTCGFAMKSKNEFYILYMPESKKKPPEDEGRQSYGKVFLAKYKK